MKKSNLIVYYVDGVKHTVNTEPAKAPKGWYANWTSKHLGRSESAAAKYTGRFNHA